MFKSIGIISALAVSSLMASPAVFAEESPAFAARNEALQANVEQREEALAAKAGEQDKSQQASTYDPQAEDAKHT